MQELTIELVPKPCWYSNLRTAMSRTKWDHLRHDVYAQYGHRCGVCEAEGKLECHEIWQYDDENHVQRLAGFIALCSWCHHVKHIGLASILAAEGKVDFERVVEHFQRINGCDKSVFERRLEDAWAQWRERNKHPWTTDLGAYSHIIDARPSPDSNVVPSLHAAIRLDRSAHFAKGSDPVIAGVSHGDEARPSTYSATYWLYADRRTGNYPDHTDRGGKWMLFVPTTRVDEVWSIIKHAVEAGKLGGSAKVATARPNPNSRNPSERVICVYTYDAEDREDVLRVRQALRELGFRSKIPYKTDEATRSRVYRVRGDERVSTYYE